MEEVVGAAGGGDLEVFVDVIADGVDAVDVAVAVFDEADEQFADDDVDVIAEFVVGGGGGFVEVFADRKAFATATEVAAAFEEVEVGAHDGPLFGEDGVGGIAVFAVELVGVFVVAGVEGTEGLVVVQDAAVEGAGRGVLLGGGEELGGGGVFAEGDVGDGLVFGKELEGGAVDAALVAEHVEGGFGGLFDAGVVAAFGVAGDTEHVVVLNIACRTALVLC